MSAIRTGKAIKKIAIMEVMNIFKGLDLATRVPEELGTEICNTIWEAVIKII